MSRIGIFDSGVGGLTVQQRHPRARSPASTPSTSATPRACPTARSRRRSSRSTRSGTRGSSLGRDIEAARRRLQHRVGGGAPRAPRRARRAGARRRGAGRARRGRAQSRSGRIGVIGTRGHGRVRRVPGRDPRRRARAPRSSRARARCSCRSPRRAGPTRTTRSCAASRAATSRRSARRASTRSCSAARTTRCCARAIAARAARRHARRQRRRDRRRGRGALRGDAPGARACTRSSSPTRPARFLASRGGSSARDVAAAEQVDIVERSASPAVPRARRANHCEMRLFRGGAALLGPARAGTVRAHGGSRSRCSPGSTTT